MLETQLYDIDLNGFTLIEDFLDEDLVQELLEEWPGRARGFAFDICLGWGKPWMGIVDAIQKHSKLFSTLLGAGYRLDHVFGCTEAFYSTNKTLHHESHMVDTGVLYSCKKGRPWTSLLALNIALAEVYPGKGGFCALPGSHKLDMPTPEGYYSMEVNPHIRQVPQKPGSCVVFTEAVTHGTYHKGHEHPRRSMIVRLCPGGMQFRENHDYGSAETLPKIFNNTEQVPFDTEGMSEFQKRLLVKPPAFTRTKKNATHGNT